MLNNYHIALIYFTKKYASIIYFVKISEQIFISSPFFILILYIKNFVNCDNNLFVLIDLHIGHHCSEYSFQNQDEKLLC